MTLLSLLDFFNELNELEDDLDNEAEEDLI